MHLLGSCLNDPKLTLKIIVEIDFEDLKKKENKILNSTDKIFSLWFQIFRNRYTFLTSCDSEQLILLLRNFPNDVTNRFILNI